MERAVVGDVHRHRDDSNTLRHFHSVEVFFVECVFHEKEAFSPDVCAADVALVVLQLLRHAPRRHCLEAQSTTQHINCKKRTL